MEAPCDPCLLGRRLEGAGRVAFGKPLLDGRHKEVAAFDAVGGDAVEHPAAAGKPAGRRANLAAHGETEAKPEGGAHGPRGLCRGEEGLMAAFERPQAVGVPVRQVGRHRQTLEVFGAERARLIDAAEDRMGVPPGAIDVGISASFELGVLCSLARHPLCPLRIPRYVGQCSSNAALPHPGAPASAGRSLEALMARAGSCLDRGDCGGRFPAGGGVA